MAHTKGQSKPKLLIFDFDGTLVDTAPDIIRATNRFLSQKGFAQKTDQEIRLEIGLGLKKLITDIYPEGQTNAALQQEILQEFTSIYEEEYLKTPALFSGALEFLEKWNGKVAIVSNKRMRFIKPILEKLNLHNHNWVSVIGGDTFNNMKPHPEPFLAAIAAAGTRPPDTWIIGDGLPDVEGAKAIGSPCLAVEFGYTPITELMAVGAWKSLSSFHALHPMIESLGEI